MKLSGIRLIKNSLHCRPDGCPPSFGANASRRLLMQYKASPFFWTMADLIGHIADLSLLIPREVASASNFSHFLLSMNAFGFSFKIFNAIGSSISWSIPLPFDSSDKSLLK